MVNYQLSTINYQLSTLLSNLAQNRFVWYIGMDKISQVLLSFLQNEPYFKV
ncbi:MAG: hypothetical protein DSM107014_07175 [Gomphosphaeria aponina SAG 52.96 = DSM 107014]|uniref:Uncharacterized protein n=1 Tax=Gomphosphaeria aponina SAG 52.96 = DSM 107014 TaxID=1521640 RepID=A0A941GPV9_9CHRO|nr:hypothetical protein [Gomphosphaeria aponina SAG 52.96 = DSM 107014]